MKKLSFKNIFRSNEISFNDEGIAVCPYCNGTGQNAEFELLNKFHEIIEFPLTVHCPKCYGKKYTDWIEVTNGRIDEEMEYLFHATLNIPSNTFLPFLNFVYNGYKFKMNDEENYLYDKIKDRWIVTEQDDWHDHIKWKNEMLVWINNLICAGYIRDSLSADDFAKNSFPSVDVPNFFSFFYDPDIDRKYAAIIKYDILNTTEVRIDDLIKAKDNLKILGFTIEDLNEICTCDESGETIETDFVFTWRNLLDKFKLPHRHKYSPVPEGVLIID